MRQMSCCKKIKRILKASQIKKENQDNILKTLLQATK